MTGSPSPEALQALHERIRGEVLLPGDHAYDDARAVWNGRFDPHPALIVRCHGTDDVVAAVNLAREHDAPLSVRGGGHSYAGYSLGDGGVGVDLSQMKSVAVDPHAEIAAVGPGATWADVDAATQAFGLATTGATVSTVGVAGYTLGGGTGYLARRHGLAADNLVAADVVTADGRPLRANEDDNPDLLWAIRGGGGNFGVVTSFELRLHAVGPEVVSAQAFHPFDEARDVLRFYREFMERAPDDVTVYAFILRTPPVEPFPDAFHGKPALALVACHCGGIKEGEATLRPIHDFGSPFLRALQRMPYSAMQQSFDAGMPKGLRWYTRAHYLRALTDDAIDTMVRYTAALPGPFTMAYLEPGGGAVARVPPDAIAFPHRSAPFALHIFPGWTDPADDAELMRWAREFSDAMAAFATGGVYVNLLDRDEYDRVPAAYGDNYARLSALKTKWDPDNLFRCNQNIVPG